MEGLSHKRVGIERRRRSCDLGRKTQEQSDAKLVRVAKKASRIKGDYAELDT
jgi:hypothetical protein